MKCECGNYPTIIIPGIGQSKTIEVDENGNMIRKAWPLDLDTDALVKKLIPSALRMVVFRRDCGFTKALSKAIKEGIDTLACYPDGEPKHRIQTVSYNCPLSECSESDRGYVYRMVPMQRLSAEIGEDHLFFFAYDIFCRISKTVDALDEFIQMVKEKTGHDKVNLAPVSMGGTVTFNYLDKYGDKGDINRIVGVVPAYDGSVMISEIVKGNINIDSFGGLLSELVGRKDAEMIKKYIAYVPKKLVEPIARTAISAMLEAAVLNSETMWALVPSSEYEALRDKYISDEAHKRLREASDKAFNIRKDPKAVVERFPDISFFTLCGYGVRLVEALGDGKISSDMIVNTTSCSMGAYLSDLGETLPSDYVQKCDCGHNHISPDRTLDASCGAIPESTWYWKNMEHEQAAENEDLLNLAKLLLRNNDIKSIHDAPGFPQFSEFVK